MQENPAKGVVWDLSDLYISPDDPRLEADLQSAESRAAAFEEKYKPLLERTHPENTSPLAGLLKDYKEIITLLTKPGVYSSLYFAEQTNDPSRGAFLQKTRTQITDIYSHTLFFQVRWNKLGAETAARWLAEPSLQNDRHFLENLRRFAPFTLSEGEEKILSVKSNTSSGAFARLFDEVLNRVPFFIEIDGQKLKKTEGEILSLLHSPEREKRKKASDSLAEGLKANTHIFTYIFNMILADHRTSLKLRSYKHPMDPMNLSNEIDGETAMGLVRSVRAAYPLAERYFRLKGKILGLDKMADYDRYAPVGREERSVDFASCKTTVLEGFEPLGPEAMAVARQFFDRRWIDAEIREGKQGGGFCCQTTPDLHPYILVNYTGQLRDVMTVAHELGHGLHQYLARRAGILESDAPLVMAETASVFGEMLVFEKILSKEQDPKKRLSLLCGKIDDNFATVFRQIAMTDFELSAHETGLSEGELDTEHISDLWIDSNARMYGKSVELTENYRHGWKYIPHFIHTPFYCYAYAFAQLFVLSLFEKFKEDRAAFVPKYLEMLSLGGSKKPEVVAAIAGLDIQRPDFWKDGLRFLEELVTEAEELAV